MSVARITEIKSSSKKSFEDAVENRYQTCRQDIGKCSRRLGTGSGSYRWK